MSVMNEQSQRPRILSVIGARPEIIQAAPVSSALDPLVDEILVHTGQHYDAAMSEGQISATHLPTPNYNLGVGSCPREEQIALAQERLAQVLIDERPDAVVVRGDTNATLSGARAATAAGVTLIHIEAGLRSYRHDMPEELNRIETDRLADILLAPTDHAARTLESEQVGGEIHVTGDPLCDILERFRASTIPEQGEYLLATVHRNYNTDDPRRMAQVLACLASSPWPVLLPLHPRTAARLDELGLALPANVRVLGPVSYPRMLELERGAQVIATDSGGVQREAYMWGVPCVTLREESEWTPTVELGWNTLVGVDPLAFAAALQKPRPRSRPPVFGDGHAADRIAAIVAEVAGRSSSRRSLAAGVLNGVTS
jgi:UDP-GlcNAc3NAcA epimerase